MGEGGGQEPETRGYRVYLIREALGTRRDALPLEQFAEMIARVSDVTYDTSVLSRMETGKRKVTLEDIEAIAPVDPLKRGKVWLAGWDDEIPLAVPLLTPAPEPQAQQTLPSHGHSLPDNSADELPVPSEQRGRKRANGR